MYFLPYFCKYYLLLDSCSLFIFLGEFVFFNALTTAYLFDVPYASTCQVLKFYPILHRVNHIIQINVVSNLMNKLSILASSNSEYISHDKHGPE